MFHYDDGVARITQFLQGIDEAEVVPLVQTDTRFIKDIKYIHELRSNLSSQTDTLAFSTRQGNRCTVERKIIQAHIEQETESAFQFLQDFGSNLLLLAIEMRLYIFQPIIQFVDIHASQLINVLVMNTEMQGFPIQACSLTIRAHIGLGKLVGPLLCGGRSILFLHHLDVLHNTFVRSEIIRCGMDEAAFNLDSFV